MNIITLQEELEKILDFYFSEMPEDESKAIQLLTDIDNKCNKIIAIDPYNAMAREYKFVANSQDFFFNTNTLIENAEFIIEHKEFNTIEKNEAYNLLAFIYEHKLAMPNKAISILDEYLTKLKNTNQPHHEIASKQSEVLHQIASILFNNNNTQKAISAFIQSYNLDALNHDRNTTAVITLLKLKQFQAVIPIIQTYHNWCYHYEDTDKQCEITQILYDLYTTGEISKYPELIAVMFDLIRNNEEEFNLTDNLDFYKQYFPKLEQDTYRFKNHSTLWFIVGNTYFFDLEDYTKAYEAYLKCLQGDDPNNFIIVYDRLKYCCHKLNKDFLSLPFSFKGKPKPLYNALTNFRSYYYNNGGDKDYYSADEEYKNTKKDIRYLKLASKFGEACYQQFKTYFETGVGSGECNFPHLFAMCCNNYGLVLQVLYPHNNNGEFITSDVKHICKIHSDGYHYSPFTENLENQFEIAYDADLYDICLKATLQYEDDFLMSVDPFDQQNCYWYQIACYIQKDDRDNTYKTYLKAKDCYLQNEDEDAKNKFIDIAEEYFMHEIENVDDLKTVFPEIEWFTQKKFVSEYPVQEGVLSYCKGLAYAEQKENTKALKYLEKSVELLKTSNKEYHKYMIEGLDRILKQFKKRKFLGLFSW